MIFSFLQGFGVGAGLIAALGAQNAFVLVQGIRQNYHGVVALICICCDVVLISAGTGGVGALVASQGAVAQWMAWIGAGFLFAYGAGSFRSALRGNGLILREQQRLSRKEAVITTLAVTLLNPHVYLDTVLLLGGISSQFKGWGRLAFAAGAACASVVWFSCLSLGGRLLAPFFRDPRSWRMLDILMGITMWTIAGSLLVSG